MSQFEILHDVGETLRQVLKDALTAAGFGAVHVSTDRPKKDAITALPTVNLYLYHIAFAENYRERNESLVTTYDKDGRIVEFYQDAPATLDAHYAISAWGNAPAEETLLLGLVVKTLLEHPMLAGDALRGDAFHRDDKINVLPNLKADPNDLMAFWRALNEELRPTLFYLARFQIASERRSAAIQRVVKKTIHVHR